MDVPAPVTEPGANDAVMPPGMPVAVSVTTPVKPPDAVTVTVGAANPPCGALAVPGTEMEKSGVATVRVTVVLWVKDPLTPCTVIGYVPLAADADAVKVSVEVPDPEIEDGAKDAVTPEGSPVAESATLPLKPPTGDTVIVEPVAFPGEVLTPVGFAEIVKSAFPITNVTGML
jgi:hypothetical protein